MRWTGSSSPPWNSPQRGGRKLGVLSLRYLQRHGGILLPPAAMLSLRMRGFALYLGMIRRGRLEWVIVPGATCRERWRGKIRLLIFFDGVQMLRAGLLVTLCRSLRNDPSDSGEVWDASSAGREARDICTLSRKRRSLIFPHHLSLRAAPKHTTHSILP